MEFSEIVVKDNPGLCRCCLSEGCYKDMGSDYTWMNETEIYADMLLECFDISISQHNEGPNGPNRLICEVCITRLRDACYFKKQVLDSEKKFVDMVGRGEFKSKVVVYQTQMKAESAEEAAARAEDTDGEYLDDDMAFVDDELDQKHDESEVAASSVTADPLPVRNKRGRPKKATTTKSTKKKVKVEKNKNKALVKVEREDEPDRKELVNFLTMIIENSTIIPFRFPSNKFMCFYCGLLIDESFVLRQHTMTEHDDANLSSVMTLWNIKTVKLDISEITCKRCLKRIDTFEEFLTHAASDHNLSFKEDVTKTMFCFKLECEPLKCMECNEEFKFFGPLLKHTHKFHNKSNKYLCEICGHGFVTIGNAMNHYKLYHAKKECSICNESFSTIYALTNHELVVHNKQKLKCPQCPEVLNSGYLKKRHLAIAHNVQSCQYKCDDCDKVFTVRSRLVDHRDRVHLKVKSVECEICGFKVYNKDMLKRHMIKHDDSRPFECQYCKKSFQRKKTLVWHTRIHTNDRRYVCSQCGKSFLQLTSLKAHFKVHHPASEEPSWD